MIPRVPLLITYSVRFSSGVQTTSMQLGEVVPVVVAADTMPINVDMGDRRVQPVELVQPVEHR
jgi:hypothetical protein